MLTSQLLAEVKDKLKAPNATLYPDDMIVRAATRSYRSLFRTLVESNKEYANFSLALFKSSALQIFQNCWQYRTPSWISHVVDLYERLDQNTTTSTLSPYLWTGSPATLGQIISKDREDPRIRWRWEGQHTLRLYNSTLAIDLMAQCVKIPTKLFVGRIDTAHASQSKMYLPTTPQYGEKEIEEGAYINSEWAVTSTASANATQYGDLRRCVYSQPNAISGGVRYNELTFDANWTATLAQNDTVETVVAIPDEHTELLVLKTVAAMYQRTQNLKGLQAIQGELSEEFARFQTYASGARDSKGPRRMKSKRGRRWITDPERIGYGYYP